MSKTISDEQFARLLAAERFLECLRECGVDNWEGHSEAVRIYEETYGEVE